MRLIHGTQDQCQLRRTICQAAKCGQCLLACGQECLGISLLQREDVLPEHEQGQQGKIIEEGTLRLIVHDCFA